MGGGKILPALVQINPLINFVLALFRVSVLISMHIKSGEVGRGGTRRTGVKFYTRLQIMLGDFLRSMEKFSQNYRKFSPNYEERFTGINY